MSILRKIFALLLILATGINSFGCYERTGQFNPGYYKPEMEIVCIYVSDWYKKSYSICNSNACYTMPDVASWMETAINTQSISATRLLEIVALLSNKNVSDAEKFVNIVQIIEKEQSECADEKIAQANADKIENKKRELKNNAEWRAKNYTKLKQELIDGLKLAGITFPAIIAIACFLDMGVRAYVYTLGYNVDKWLRTFNNIPDSAALKF